MKKEKLYNKIENTRADCISARRTNEGVEKTCKTRNPLRLYTHTHTHTLCLQDYSLKSVVNFACEKIYKEKSIDIKLMHRKAVLVLCLFSRCMGDVSSPALSSCPIQLRPKLGNSK